MKRLALTALLVATLSAPANASAATFFLFDRSDADPNERVTVRIGGTPASFAPSRRVKPFQRPMRLYLVRDELAAQVHSRLDRRLTFVGSIVPDKNFRGLLTFSVPPLDAGTYTLAYWCPACAALQPRRDVLRAAARAVRSAVPLAGAPERGRDRVLPGHAPERERGRRDSLATSPGTGTGCSLPASRRDGVNAFRAGPRRRRRRDRRQAALGDDAGLARRRRSRASGSTRPRRRCVCSG